MRRSSVSSSQVLEHMQPNNSFVASQHDFSSPDRIRRYDENEDSRASRTDASIDNNTSNVSIHNEATITDADYLAAKFAANSSGTPRKVDSPMDSGDYSYEEERPMYNKISPKLSKVSKYFKSKRSPGKSLLDKYKHLADDDDDEDEGISKEISNRTTQNSNNDPNYPVKERSPGKNLLHKIKHDEEIDDEEVQKGDNTNGLGMSSPLKSVKRRKTEEVNQISHLFSDDASYQDIFNSRDRGNNLLENPYPGKGIVLSDNVNIQVANSQVQASPDPVRCENPLLEKSSPMKSAISREPLQENDDISQNGGSDFETQYIIQSEGPISSNSHGNDRSQSQRDGKDESTEQNADNGNDSNIVASVPYEEENLDTSNNAKNRLEILDENDYDTHGMDLTHFSENADTTILPKGAMTQLLCPNDRIVHKNDTQTLNYGSSNTTQLVPATETQPSNTTDLLCNANETQRTQESTGVLAKEEDRNFVEDMNPEFAHEMPISNDEQMFKSESGVEQNKLSQDLSISKPVLVTQLLNSQRRYISKFNHEILLDANCSLQETQMVPLSSLENEHEISLIQPTPDGAFSVDAPQLDLPRKLTDVISVDTTKSQHTTDAPEEEREPEKNMSKKLEAQPLEYIVKNYQSSSSSSQRETDPDDTGSSPSSSPKQTDPDDNKSLTSTDNQHIDEMLKETVVLKVSNKPNTSDGDQEEGNLKKSTSSIIMSEGDVTQELPEMEDENEVADELEDDDQCRKNTSSGNLSINEATKTNVDMDDSDIIITRRRPHRETFDSLELTQGEENGEATLIPIEQTTTPAEPEGTIRTVDERYLNLNDIKFKNSIWCQYKLDMKYYPAILLKIEKENNECKVRFSDRDDYYKIDDVHPLDIRINDTVNFLGHPYVVVGLEAKNKEEDTIRCIRGYDTLHLKKKTLAGTLVGETVITPLSSIHIELEEWYKRAKINPTADTDDNNTGHEDLKHPIRGRGKRRIISTQNLKRNGRHPNYEEIDSEDSDSYLTQPDAKGDEQGTPSIHYSISAVPKQAKIDQSNTPTPSEKEQNTSHNIFDECLFVITGITGGKKAEIASEIEKEGGVVLESGFADLLGFSKLIDEEHNSNRRSLTLSQSSATGQKFKFACLLSDQYRRSTKYLETLALGWPTLHFDFLNACCNAGKMEDRFILQYLLPSGESTRLHSGDNSKRSVVKSNNIVTFYNRYLNRVTLNNQLDAMNYILTDYEIIICGRTQLTVFMKFVTRCLGAETVYQMDNILSKDVMSSLADIFEKSQRQGTKLIILLNEAIECPADMLKKTRNMVHEKYSYYNVSFYVETKEWLIQTLINGDAGFTE
ncbi:chromatin-binding protein RAD9 KNAG_0A04450 [Huiozyma naganishii CBS 8797]|uniref:BRCT domain-containing protein n=1 Tax=Huiozyma naganishii (strain ATCC MYA-139 / BCRC 22969 / CBS 8797 / KCTC 17520 / NBRC 10181 / NCYC 3082 / Yp74L-3) TaxID=1071383 RepID=J7REY1_HUIN7|nr:hypothetical protein KNAG_0A04450 [Kazachstania naganishii CBS 8797]CCK68118.1 hypothetical protein KNAG_0A04450 [Kazachstania naganishii CBS 8797]